MKKEDLLQTISLAKNKDQKAQSRLINFYWSDVYNFVLGKVRDRTSADEITVTVFSKVLAKLDLYDADFQFKTWILTIAQNTVIDFWRKQNRNLEDETENLHHSKNDFAQSPEDILISGEEQENILKTVASMESGYRKIIELRFFEEKSIREISDELGISVANTKVRIMRAKKILHELLKNSGSKD